MEYNPNEPKAHVDLAAAGDYVAYVVKARGGVSKNGNEIWNVDYCLLGLITAPDDAIEDARASVGCMFSDRLIDVDALSWRWDNFLPVMFPEIKKAGETTNMVAPDCIGRTIVIRLDVVDGNQDFGDPAKINRAKKYLKFEGDMAPYAEEISKLKAKFNIEIEKEDGESPQENSEPKKSSDDFDNQF